MALKEFQGPWDRAHAAHLVRRTMFGATPSDIELAYTKGLKASIDSLLGSTSAPPEPIAYLKTGAVAEGDPWSSSAYDSSAEAVRLAFLQSWWIDLMLQQQFSLREKMMLFWSNYFSTGSQQVKDARYMFKQNAMIRSNVFGSVKDLARSVTFDPAMLRYLSGNTNTKASPNENFAREVQELFTIGKGPEVAPGDYVTFTEQDVKAAAKIFTGWTDVQATMSTKFTLAQHDTTNKQFSARYGNRVITGRNTEAGAKQEVDDLLTMIFDQPETAKTIVRKLYRWFVDYVVTPDIETNIIEPLAQTLRTNDYRVESVLRELLASEHFFDNERIGCFIKTPADLVIGTLRVFKPVDLFPTDQKKLHWAYRTLRRGMATMQMDLFTPPNVAGWPASYQEPTYHEMWINSDTLQKRIRFTNELTKDGYLLDEAYDKSYIDPFIITEWVSEPYDVAQLVDTLVTLLFPVAILPEQRQALIDIILEGQPESAWVTAWTAYSTTPDDEAKRAVVEGRLRNLLKFMLAMAEYQVC